MGPRRDRDSKLDSVSTRYRILRRLLATNSEMLEMMADLEADLRYLDPGQNGIRRPVRRLVESALLLAENLNVLTGDRYKALYDVHEEMERCIREYLDSLPAPAEQPLMVPLHAASTARHREVGGKAAHLGELKILLPDLVPDGFVVTTSAYRLFLEENELHKPIRNLMRDMSMLTGSSLFRERTNAVRSLMEASPLPRRIAEAIADGVMTFARPWPSMWAVRSSAVGEDGTLSFAGQFDSFLDVARNDLNDAYKKVLSSRFTYRSVLYRLISGVTDVDSHMAVLFMPMVEARCAGVLFTRNPADEEGGSMLVNAVPGHAQELMRGDREAAIFELARDEPGRFTGTGGRRGLEINEADARALLDAGLAVERHFGGPQEIEWVIDTDGRLKVVQSRPLKLHDRRIHGGQPVETRSPLIEGGITVYPGRVVGRVSTMTDLEGGVDVEGSILVLDQATPEIAPFAPVLGGVLARHGNPGGHAATLLREFGVPALFRVGTSVDMLKRGRVISMDATRRQVYEGNLWPEMSERTRKRIERSEDAKTPLHDRVLTLNLTDPLSLGFRASRCRSVHDIIRFTHERAVSEMFELGDAAAETRRGTWILDTEIPLALAVLDLGGAVDPVAGSGNKIRPEDIRSAPFQALWEGITTPGVKWSGRSKLSASGAVSVFAASMTDSRASIRRLGDRNYLVVGPDFLNLNARLAYHFAMVDALVTEVPENNYVNFRFRGGGAGENRRRLRARFLEDVLLESGFGVDRRGDLVTAWLRRHTRELCLQGLVTIGRLAGCARQLDMLMNSDQDVRRYSLMFLEGDYEAFG